MYFFSDRLYDCCTCTRFYELLFYGCDGMLSAHPTTAFGQMEEFNGSGFNIHTFLGNYVYKHHILVLHAYSNSICRRNKLGETVINLGPVHQQHD